MGKWIKGLGCLLIVAMLATPVFATQRKTVLADDVSLDFSTNDTGWLERYTGNSEKITFFVTMTDGASTTFGVTAQVTAQVSADGTNWADVKWFDVLGGTTSQSAQTIDTADNSYLMWFTPDALYPQVRIKVYADGSSRWYETGTNDVSVTVTLVEQK